MTEPRDGSGIMVGGDGDLAVDLEPLFQKLKPGPGLPAEQVLADQRRRLHGAMIALIDGGGWSCVRVRALARAAGVSTSTFYKHFVNADDCLASTHDAVMVTALQNAAAAQRREPDWRDSLRTTVATLIGELAADPRAARLVLLDVFSAGPSARKRIGRAVAELEQLLADSFTSAPRPVTPPRHLVAGMTAGMLRVARTTTLAGRSDELPGLADEIADWMLTLPDPEVLSLLVRRKDDGPGIRPACPPLQPEREPGIADTDDRARLLRATIKLAGLEGLSKLTASRLRAEAGVSRRGFESCFESLDECALDAIETVASEAVARSRGWSEGPEDWSRQTCRFVLALCTQAARNRIHARFAFLGIFATGRAGLLRREQMIGRIAAELRATVPPDLQPTQLVAEASVAAAWHIAQSDVAAGRSRTLPSIAPLLSYIVLAPIIGASSAAAAVRAEVWTT
jgi:AcrR family transcriptional regulator